MSNNNHEPTQEVDQKGAELTVKVSAGKPQESEQKVTTKPLKYRRKVEVAVSGINSELSKIMSSNATLKNIDGMESDMVLLGRKVNELKRALNEPKKETGYTSANALKISKQIDKLIDIASKTDIKDADKEMLLKEIKKNLGETGGYLSVVKKAMGKNDQSESFTFDS